MTVWEAMAMEIPVVSTKVGDVDEFVKNYENGFVVPIKDSVALAQKVSTLIDSKKLRKQLGKKARHTAINELNLEICVKKHAEFYRTLLKDSE
jgi:N,N'-diacetylbacillosaminyl-diphospho-undecaprenol alpha-1,3-N-acetylgalactosaminyltransferase